MHLWLVLFSFLVTPALPSEAESQRLALERRETEEMRYRGIERLLAKFDAEADDAAPGQNR